MTVCREPARREGALRGRCVQCARPLAAGRIFGAEAGKQCLRCTLAERPLLRRALLTALAVGTVLVAINQGTVLLSGSFPASLAWKIPLTYAVPFCVTMWGALGSRRR